MDTKLYIIRQVLGGSCDGWWERISVDAP
jgi:hypothetical protein